MTTNKLLMFAVAGLLVPLAADAGGKIYKSEPFLKIVNDTAPTANGKLRRTNEEQPGNEMATLVCLGAAKSRSNCLYFSMTTELNGERAFDRVQLSMTKFTLGQDATGSVIATVDPTSSIFVTNNDGNEYRTSNHPAAFNLTDDIGCVQYNWQKQNENDTKRYVQCFKADGTNVLKQTLVGAFNNDDCCMMQSGGGGQVTNRVGNKIYHTWWGGANGNGSDDGHLLQTVYDLTDPLNLTATRQFDLVLAQREERSHGHCSVFAKNLNVAICSHTEGNTQPQYDNTWLSAVDITPGKFSGSNQQQALIWKKQIDGRKNIDGVRTYSMRASHQRIYEPDPTTGELVASDKILWYSNDLQGDNNNNEKGGKIVRTMMGVIQVDEAGANFVLPLQDTGTIIKGIGGTHLHQAAGMFGTVGSLNPGTVFINGSHTGGHFDGQARSLVYDRAANKFIDGGMLGTAPWDRHYYPNRTGNNPGNQGRNYGSSILIDNPFVGMQGNTDAYLMLFASTGKPMLELDKPEIKLSAFITVVPLASTPAQSGGGNGSGSGSGDGGGNGGGNGDGDGDGDGSAGDSLGGCSTGGSTGLATFLLIGLAALIRRRR